jgi:phage gpG-like protein
MLKAKVTLEGSAALKRRLDEYSKKAQRRIRLTTEHHATEVEQAAKREAPVATANLRNSIHIASVGTDSLQIVEGGDVYGPRRLLDASLSEASTPDVKVVGSGLEYARRQEFGFSGQDAAGRTYNQPGRFFLTSALEAQRAPYLKDLREAVKDE